MEKYNNWIKGVDYPDWFTYESLVTISNGYLVDGETPTQAYNRVVKSVCDYLKLDENHELRIRLFQYIWNNWLCLSTPVLANSGTKKGLPISCYTITPSDETKSIFDKVTEMSLLTKHGGGVGINFNKIRGRGAPISTSGYSEGTIPFMKVYDSAILATSQSGVRRGAASMNMSIHHSDIEEFIRMRRPQGDVNRQCLNLHHCVSIDDLFMQKLEYDTHSRQLWMEILKTRLETGEPYIMFYDNVNNNNPKCYTNNSLKVNATNICSEITLHTDPEHSFVCCLSSINLAKWSEFKNNKQFIKDCIWFLDGVMEEFIQKGSKMKGFESAVRFAQKSRALGLGVLGWHTFLQQKSVPFCSLQATAYTNTIFKFIKDSADEATAELASEYGEPEWCRGFGIRNTHRIAIAPTTSNSILSGGVSQGIEPIISNVFNQKSAKGTFVRKNNNLVQLLKKKYSEHDNENTWNSITENSGSVQHLDFLSEDEKDVFLTFAEINQLELVKQASVRQKYIDQSQSLNLCFPSNTNAKWIHKVHYEAWVHGIKTLYYLRTSSILRGDMNLKTFSEDCKYCEG